MSEQKTKQAPHMDAIDAVHYHFRSYVESSEKVNAAHHLVELANAVSDLVSFHPDYDAETGTMPWERE